MSEVPEADRWPVQVSASFGFVEQLGFRVVDGGSYRLGNWTLFGNGSIGIYLDCDGYARSLALKLVRLENGYIALRDPKIGLSFTIVPHPAQPAPYVDDRGRWEWAGHDGWRWVRDEHLRVYDLVRPASGE